MDVGCYPVSMVRLIVGEEPEEIEAFAKLSETGVDSWASAILRFPNTVARVATAVSVALDNSVEIFGTSGSIRIDRPWFGARDADGNWSFDLYRNGERETVEGTAKPIYVLEVDAVAEALAAAGLSRPAWTGTTASATCGPWTGWRRLADVRFDFEKTERQTVPIHGRPLTVRREVMQHGNVAGLDKPVSRLVLGCDNQPSGKHAAVMFDNYFEYGGNTFDTAHIYGGGRMEEFLGTWIKNRGVREKVVVIGKARTRGQLSGSRRRAIGHLVRTLADRLHRYLLPAPRQRGYSRLRMDGRLEPRAGRWPNQGVRRLELVLGARPGGQRLCRRARPDAIRGGVQQLQLGAHGGPDLARLRCRVRRRLARLAGDNADAPVPLVQPGARLLHVALRQSAGGIGLRRRRRLRQSAERC